jgi:sugar lactone lactonase YvrE
VLRYDLASGSAETFADGGGLDNPIGLTFGPDGDLYVGSALTDQVLRYDGTSGVFLGVFAQGGGLDDPRQVNFGPDGELYVANAATNSILRFDGRTGAPLGTFASGGGLNGPTSFTFGPDGDLYVGSVLNNRIKRFDGRTGAFLGNFVASSLNGPHDLAFGPDGALYVTNAFSTRIQRFDGESGAFLGSFVLDARLAAPLGLSWDEAGRMYVVNQAQDEVLRYDGRTGAFLDAVVAPGAGGVSAPLFAAFEPAADLEVLDPAPGIAGAPSIVAIRGATPGAAVRLGIGERRELQVVQPTPLAPSSHGADDGTLPLCLPAAVAEVPLVGDESGRALFDWPVPPSAAGGRFLLRALEPLTRRSSPLLRWRF